MSVIEYDSKTYGKLARSLMTHEYQLELFTWAELTEMKNDSKALNKDEQEYIESNIIWFANRLYFSNQIAYYRQNQLSKGEQSTFYELSHNDVYQTPYTTKELLDILRSIRYNLADNCGHTFLPIDDVKRLDSIIEYVAFELLAYQKAEEYFKEA